MNLKAPMTVELVGRGKVKLSPVHHLATGGEGTVFRLGDVVIKLYTDPTQMTREQTADKIARLALLSHPYVVSPRGIVIDLQGRPIGLYMDYTVGEALARAFTNDWRSRQKFGDREASLVAARMRDAVSYAHSQGAVMADANELNWTIVLTRGSQPEPRVIDVDSWAIGRWPARVIMPSIRDWHAKDPTPATDWFAWGVVTFQLYTGIHPYKGTLAGYKPSELVRRMQDNASIFSPGIKLNRAVRDFSCIPGPLIGWYKATFHTGLREAPPSPLQTGSPRARRQVAATRIATSSALNYELVYEGAQDPAVRVFGCGVVQLASGKLYDLNTGRVIASLNAGVELVRVEGGWLAASIEKGQVAARFIAQNLQSSDITLAIGATHILRSGNRLFAVTDQGLTELKLLQLGRPRLLAGQTWGALLSTKWFDGIGIQDAMGATHLIVPFADDACAQIRASELDGQRVINAVAGYRFASVVSIDSQGLYHRFDFSFDRSFRGYALATEIVDGAELNLTILPRGVCASIVTDGELKIYVPSNGQTKTVIDQDATTALRLANWNEAVIGLRQGSVYRLKLR
jgi:hypothetical protein